MTGVTQPPPITPDTKDWTWALRRPCPECGFDSRSVDRADLGRLIRENAASWSVALGAPRATVRPRADVWSVTEYACHVRDVHVLFAERLGLMLHDDDPVFANWDQDVTAVESRYDLAQPHAVAAEFVAAADNVAAVYDAVPDDAWSRPGRRSNGDRFTVESLGRYHLHDVVHHLWDVAGAATVAGYEVSAREYREAARDMSDPIRAAIDAFVAALPAGARVIEIGSGGGGDARALEDAGLSVRRTDITPAFVDLLRDDGYDADVLDPLVDDLDDPARPGVAYDGVWASACLFHVARSDLPEVLRRLAAATREGGVFYASLREGDGETWSSHGAAAPWRAVLWREAGLRPVLEAAGWEVGELARWVNPRGEAWLGVVATRR